MREFDECLNNCNMISTKTVVLPVPKMEMENIELHYNKWIELHSNLNNLFIFYSKLLPGGP